MASDEIRTWLDTVDEGYADLFGHVFAAMYARRLDDLATFASADDFIDACLTAGLPVAAAVPRARLRAAWSVLHKGETTSLVARAAPASGPEPEAPAAPPSAPPMDIVIDSGDSSAPSTAPMDMPTSADTPRLKLTVYGSYFDVEPGASFPVELGANSTLLDLKLACAEHLGVAATFVPDAPLPGSDGAGAELPVVIHCPSRYGGDGREMFVLAPRTLDLAALKARIAHAAGACIAHVGFELVGGPGVGTEGMASAEEGRRADCTRPRLLVDHMITWQPDPRSGLVRLGPPGEARTGRLTAHGAAPGLCGVHALSQWQLCLCFGGGVVLRATVPNPLVPGGATHVTLADAARAALGDTSAPAACADGAAAAVATPPPICLAGARSGEGAAALLDVLALGDSARLDVEWTAAVPDGVVDVLVKTYTGGAATVRAALSDRAAELLERAASELATAEQRHGRVAELSVCGSGHRAVHVEGSAPEAGRAPPTVWSLGFGRAEQPTAFLHFRAPAAAAAAGAAAAARAAAPAAAEAATAGEDAGGRVGADANGEHDEIGADEDAAGRARAPRARRVTVDVALASHPLLSTAATDQLPLSAWGICDGDSVHALARWTRTACGEGDVPRTGALLAGRQGQFADGDAWWSAVGVPQQSASARAGVLASLLVLADSLRGGARGGGGRGGGAAPRGPSLARVLHVLRVWLRSDHPAVAALRELALGHAIAPSAQAWLGCAVLRIARRLAPGAPPPPASLGEHVRSSCAQLLIQSEAELGWGARDELGQWRELRLETGAAAPAAADDADGGGADDGEGEGLAGVDLRALALAAPGRDEIRIWAPSSAAAWAAALNARTLCAPGEGELVALSSAAHARAAAAQPSAARCMRIIPSALLPHAPRPSLCRDETGRAAAYVGTWTSGVGASGDELVSLFLPLEGKERQSGVKALQAKLVALGLESEQASAAELESEMAGTPDEATVLVLDVSASMAGSASFGGHDEQEEQRREEEASRAAWRHGRVEPHEWRWDMRPSRRAPGDRDARNSRSSADEDDEESESDGDGECGHGDDDDDDDDDCLYNGDDYDDAAAVACLRAVPGYSHALKLARSHSPEAVLRELCHVESPLKPYNSELYAAARDHFVLLKLTLAGDSVLAPDGRSASRGSRSAAAAPPRGGAAAGSAEAAVEEDDEGDDDVPEPFRCPITWTLLDDPVVAPDGNTYSRDALGRWLAHSDRSPLTGAPMNTRLPLTPNFNLRSQIHAWLDGSGAGTRGALRGTAGAPAAARVVSFEVAVLAAPSDRPRAARGGGAAERAAAVRVTVPRSAPLFAIAAAVARATDGAVWPTHAAAPNGAWADLGTGARAADAAPVSVRQLHSLCPPAAAAAAAGPASEDSVGADGGPPRRLLVQMRAPVGRRVRVRDPHNQSAFARWSDAPVVFDERVDGSETVGGLLVLLWERLGIRPGGRMLWYDVVEQGDDRRVGQPATLTHARIPAHVTELVLHYPPAPTPTRRGPEPLSRLAAAQAVLHAFCNRVQAYRAPHELGLVLVGTEAREVCALTPVLSRFRAELDGAHAKGNTALRDGLALAAQMLRVREARHRASAAAAGGGDAPPLALRVLCVSDGEDTCSSAANSTPAVEAALGPAGGTRARIVVDCVAVGRADHEPLCALAKRSGGLAFWPQQLRTALQLCELDPVISCLQRPPPAPFRGPGSPDFDAIDRVPGRPVPELGRTVRPLSDALAALDAAEPSAGGGGAGSASRAVLRELRELHRAPHPHIDVFPSDDVRFWRIVIAGPEGTPYERGTWAGFVRLPAEYPADPPEVRLVTPIRHCNINAHGRVCHSILDRNWTPATRMRTVLDCVYSLLLTPDTADPLDSHLSLSFYGADGGYEAAIIEHTRTHASVSRAEWGEALRASSLTAQERLAACRGHLASMREARLSGSLAQAIHAAQLGAAAVSQWPEPLASVDDVQIALESTRCRLHLVELRTEGAPHMPEPDARAARAHSTSSLSAARKTLQQLLHTTNTPSDARQRRDHRRFVAPRALQADIYYALATVEKLEARRGRRVAWLREALGAAFDGGVAARVTAIEAELTDVIAEHVDRTGSAAGSEEPPGGQGGGRSGRRRGGRRQRR